MYATLMDWLLAMKAALNRLDPNLLLTVLLIIPAYWSAIISRNTAKRQLRAYLTVDAPRLEVSKTSGQWVVYYGYKNNGQTPAYGVSLSAAHCVVDREDAPLPPIGAPYPYALGTIGPSELIRDSEPTELSDADVEMLKTTGKVLTFFGELKYVDAFRKKRKTRFRFFTGGSAPFAGPFDPELTIYVKGNDSD